MAFPLPYSTQLLAVAGVSAPVTVVIPGGFRAVLRDIDVYYGGGFSSGGAFYLIGSAGQTIMQWQLDSPHGASQHLETRQVIYGGESFEARSDSPVDVTVSGYLLHEPT